MDFKAAGMDSMEIPAGRHVNDSLIPAAISRAPMEPGATLELTGSVNQSYTRRSLF